MKITTIIGARPQFIKAAPVSRAIAEHNYLTEVIIRTGQHFDADMSDVFFKELDIPMTSPYDAQRSNKSMDVPLQVQSSSQIFHFIWSFLQIITNNLT